MSALPHSHQSASNAAKEQAFDWPLAYAAEQLLHRHIESFLSRHSFARELSDRMREATGTDFYEWVDYLTLSPEHQIELTAVGLSVANTPAPTGIIVMHHPKAMMPRVLLSPPGSHEGAPATLAVRPEVLLDFLAVHAPAADIEGDFGTRFRRALVAGESGLRLEAVERLGYRGFLMENPRPGIVAALLEAQALFKQRRREFADDADGIRHAREILDQVLALVPREVACELFFAEERRYWEQRNLAGRVQKKRQDALGLGWGNHDHHTFRCSRRLFPDVVQFLERLGLQKRERFYAGAEAGWGAQVMESSEVGIVVFADVDLRPDEVNEDYAAKRLPEGDEGIAARYAGDEAISADPAVLFVEDFGAAPGVGSRHLTHRMFCDGGS